MARWDGDPDAVVNFSLFPKANKVKIFGVYKGNQPDRTAGQMIADSVKKEGMPQPSMIEITEIQNDRTIQELASGVHPSASLLGRTIANAAQEFGGHVNIEDWDYDSATFSWIRAKVTYP